MFMFLREGRLAATIQPKAQAVNTRRIGQLLRQATANEGAYGTLYRIKSIVKLTNPNLISKPVTEVVIYRIKADQADQYPQRPN